MRRHSLVRVARFGTFSSRHMVVRRSTARPSTPMSFAVQITGCSIVKRGTDGVPVPNIDRKVSICQAPSFDRKA